MPVNGVRKSEEGLSLGDRDRAPVSTACVCVCVHVRQGPLSDLPLWVRAAGASMEPTARTGVAAHPSWTRFSAATSMWPSCCSNSMRYRNGSSHESQTTEHL